jgi:hypothetical protein
MKPTPNLLSIALIGCGVAGFVVASKPLLASKEADAPLNVLGINRSPYGEVFAMAMQGPIDTHFHATEFNGHVCDDGCGHEKAEKTAVVSSAGVNDRLRGFIDGMGTGLTERTNPRGASEAHKFYLRREIEDKLRFAYNLDPSHYGNYNAYHFFLTEPKLGTRPELTPHAAKLADQTIAYCLSQRNDPRQALTAAAAAGNVIELMFNDRHVNPEQPRFTTDQMKGVLKVMDQSIGLYAGLANEWADKGLWANLSELRLAETQERLDFVLKIRDTHEQAIRRLEGISETGETAKQGTTNFN